MASSDAARTFLSGMSKQTIFAGLMSKCTYLWSDIARS